MSRTTTKKKTTLDAYVRVSRVGGHEGDSYRSPGQQLAAIQAWADANGVAIGKTVKDEDVSGKKRARDRGLGELLDRAERGSSGGVIVYRLNRFGRNMADTVEAVTRLKDAGKRLVLVDDGYDTGQPNGQVLLGVFAGLAEMQLDERRENWAASQREAIADGVHIARPPTGYRRSNGKRSGLERDPETAPAVRAAFEARARGATLGEVARALTEATNGRFSPSNTRYLLGNRVYLGTAFGPRGEEKQEAHPPIVTRELFAAAQRKTRGNPKDGSLASQAMLAGIVTCASCGKRLAVKGRVGKGGGRVAFYCCTTRYTGGECDAPAIANVAHVDEHVEWLLANDENSALAGAQSAEVAYVEAREAVAAAEAKLEMWVDDDGADPATQKAMIGKCVKALEEARARLWDMDDPGLPADASLVELDGHRYVYTTDVRRGVREAVGTMTLSKGEQGRRLPIGGRVRVTWRDGSEPVIPDVADAA